MFRIALKTHSTKIPPEYIKEMVNPSTDQQGDEIVGLAY